MDKEGYQELVKLYESHIKKDELRNNLSSVGVTGYKI